MTATPTSSAAACWSCQASVDGGHFCAACGKIQPLPRGTDYFAFFGLPRKLWIDMGELEQRFHQLSWKLHPDNFVKAGEYERGLSLERSSQLNDAYRTLLDPISRVEYLLGLAGVRKEGQAKQQAPPELLEEVFELNESLDELRAVRSAGGPGQAGAGNGSEMVELTASLEMEQHKFEKLLKEVDGDLQHIARDWDASLDSAAPESHRASLLKKMNEALNRRSYIRNLVSNVQKELAET